MTKTYQLVLTMSTKTSSLRSEATGWSLDSGLLAHNEIINRKDPQVMVGLIPGKIEWYAYPTVLHALGNGFKLLAPPTMYKEVYSKGESNERVVEEWEWWLVKDEECRGGIFQHGRPNFRNLKSEINSDD